MPATTPARGRSPAARAEPRRLADPKPELTDPLLDELAAVVGRRHVLSEAELTASYEVDWTRRWAGRARAVVRPGSTDEVAAVLRTCRTHAAAVVPQGGNTGLVGGSVPGAGEVVLSLRRLDAIGAIDEAAGQVTVGAGTTLGAVAEHVGAGGLGVGVDLAARDSATVGGMVATNAGGIHVLRHGTMRSRVAGLEAVFADGSVVSRLDGLMKDNSGYDLPGLLCGSEGTLAVVTQVRLRLVGRPRHVLVVLAGVAGTEAALAVLARVRRLTSLQAAEAMHADGLALVREHAGLAPPFRTEHPVYLLLEFGADRDPTEEVAAALAECSEVADTAVATDRPGREGLWAYRERHTEAINALGIPHKLDVTLPPHRLADFEAVVRERVAAAFPGSAVILFGHLGDGNVHVNIVGPDPEDESVDDLVLRLVAERGGSISAEHGIGRAKARWLSLTRSPADLAAMQAVKRALDPDNMLNPGVIFPNPGT